MLSHHNFTSQCSTKLSMQIALSCLLLLRIEFISSRGACSHNFLEPPILVFSVAHLCSYEFSLYFIQVSILLYLALAGYWSGTCGYFKIPIQRVAVVWISYIVARAFCKCRIQFRGKISSLASNWRFLKK